MTTDIATHDSGTALTRTESLGVGSEPINTLLHFLATIATAVVSVAKDAGDIATSLRRIAEAQPPAEGEIVGTPHVARQWGGKTTQYIAQLATKGIFPSDCIVPGTGNGKQWRFFKDKI